MANAEDESAYRLTEIRWMLGWHISVHRQNGDGDSPATIESPKGTRLAVWQTSLGGLKWIDELVKAGKITNLGGNGYPLTYTARAECVIPYVVEKPPKARDNWMSGAGDILADKWEGTTVIDRAAIRACRLDEWLVIEAWDES